jgi:hypothetical protein
VPIANVPIQGVIPKTKLDSAESETNEAICKERLGDALTRYTEYASLTPAIFSCNQRLVIPGPWAATFIRLETR